MPDLHPATLKAIAEGPIESAPYDDGKQEIESIEEFARRVALIEQEAEREECAKVADSMSYGPCGEFDRDYGEAQFVADSRAEAIAADIRARGQK